MMLLTLLALLLIHSIIAFQPHNHVLLSTAATSSSSKSPPSFPSALNDLPQVNLDSLKSFTVDVPQIDTTSLLKVDETFIVPTVGLLGVFVVLGALQKSAGPKLKVTNTMKRRKNRRNAALLSIPYDAAAQLAYQEWLNQHTDQVHSDEGYQVFKERYDAWAVALSTTKKLQRDLDSFDNTVPSPPPPRRISTKKPTKTKKSNSPFFFADD